MFLLQQLLLHSRQHSPKLLQDSLSSSLDSSQYSNNNNLPEMFPSQHSEQELPHRSRLFNSDQQPNLSS